METGTGANDKDTVPTRFVWDSDVPATTVSVVGTFDRFMQHAMKKDCEGKFTTVLYLPEGDYLFKYVVDGEYCVRRNVASKSLHIDREGKTYHRLIVRRPSNPDAEVAEENIQPNTISPKPSERLSPDANSNTKRGRKTILQRAGNLVSRRSASVPRRTSPPVPRGTSPATAGAASQDAAPLNDQRTARSSWRRSLKPNRGSLVSAPVTIDPVDPAEVETKVRQWRSYAKTLQQWSDYEGAAVLYKQAMNLLEQEDRRNSPLYASVIMDLAHVYNRQEEFAESENAVKRALAVYSTIGYDRPERQGDLLSYLAVTVDRQKRREDAEVYYREALRVYHLNNVNGDNVEVTEKNLRFNLKKQVMHLGYMAGMASN